MSNAGIYIFWPTSSQPSDIQLDQKKKNEFIKRALSSFLDREVFDLVIQSDIKGKPYFLGQYSAVQFNVSHSKGVFAVAFSTRGPIGIDFEYVDPTLVNKDMYSLLFNNEKEIYLAEKFFKAWTVKEAFFKMLGSGIDVEKMQESHVEWLSESLAQLEYKNETHKIQIFIDQMNCVGAVTLPSLENITVTDLFYPDL